MKKVLILMMSALLVLGVFSGCAGNEKGSSSVAAENESTIASSQEQKGDYIKNPLSGEYNLDPAAKNKRPLGIMINNIKVSLPQRGISQADLYYEVLAEGGITRILAIFPDYTKVPDVGSVRSARHYFLRLAQGHDAIYMHFGGSPIALETIKNEGLNTINCLYTAASYRDKTRVGKIPYEHTAFSNAELIAKAIKNKNIKTDGKISDAFKFGKNDLSSGTAAGSITVPFSSYDVATFNYNATSGLYEKSEFGSQQIDGTTGKVLSVKNVFVLKTSISKLANSDNPSRIDVDLTEGNGYYACGGKLIPVKWKKGGNTDMVKYYTEDGKELSVNTGKTWVCFISSENEVSYK